MGEMSVFQSIWRTFWWAITTLTYMGYGDEIPQSPLGRFVYVFAILTAIFSFLVPISIVLSRVAIQVERYEELRSAARLGDCSQSELLVKVFQLSQELNLEMGEIRKTQKTLGILLYKLGKTGISAHRLFMPTQFSQDSNDLSRTED